MGFSGKEKPSLAIEILTGLSAEITPLRIGMTSWRTLLASCGVTATSASNGCLRVNMPSVSCPFKVSLPFLPCSFAYNGPVSFLSCNLMSVLMVSPKRALAYS